MAPLRHRTDSISENVPDTGELRGDVLEVMHTVARRYQQIGPDAVHGLMAEAHDLRPDYLPIVEGVMRTVLNDIFLPLVRGPSVIMKDSACYMARILHDHGRGRNDPLPPGR
jgi:hypothetical protein